MADVGALVEKGLTLKTGQTHVHKYLRPLLGLIEQGRIDTTWLISHRASLEEAPGMYRHWHDEQDSYTKIILKPEMAAPRVERVAEAAQAG